MNYKTSKINGNGQKLWKEIFALIGVVAIFFLPMLFGSTGIKAMPGVVESEYAKALPQAVDSLKIYRECLERADDHYNAVKNDLAEEVDRYIKSVSKRSRMTGQNIVEKCLDYEYDITLLMAQGHLETHFGAMNRNSNVFGLHKKRYSHPDHAVDDYIRLMQSKYLITRTPEQLIASNFRLEKGKGHYAGHASYGTLIKKFRDGIIKGTEIDMLFRKCLQLKEERDSLKFKIENHQKKIFERRNIHDSTLMIAG